LIDFRKTIEDNADPAYRDFHTSIVPGIEKVYGVRTPVLRDLSKKILKNDWRSFLETEPGCYEELIIRAMVIAKAPVSVEERLAMSRDYVEMIDNWALCDVFCGDWKVRPGDKGKLWSYVLELIGTGEEFKMRVASVMMLVHFLDEEHIDEVLSILSTAHHNGYYYKMGAAWALSFCFIKYPEKTEPFLFADTLDKDIRNKAVQKICDSFRVGKEDKERLKEKKKLC
jgi:3-methyladenine DNA glycosylase AlkD